MLRLLLLRHAEAAPAAGGGDINRRLTAGGRAAASRIGAYLRKAQLVPGLALVSPARRTLETFEELQFGASCEIPRIVAPSLYNASMGTIFALLQETPANIERLLFIGHNPGLAEAAVLLSREGERAALARLRAQFPAPSLAIIDFDANDWRQASQDAGRLDIFLTLTSNELQGGA
ncbi:SixA phosphatase family protein [Methylocella silvestris]|uniref:Phosphohistidine phosphatase, SixA n=1 Tax=Methylocella silvestris TaxID=199596 RepID=A0A2J7TLE7_METSI|nr:histidine phosphatase family protein [Methylocella silvestris]PNG27595.1 hypothetical protein CR492_01370 [Methylocella silvestris]